MIKRKFIRNLVIGTTTFSINPFLLFKRSKAETTNKNNYDTYSTVEIAKNKDGDWKIININKVLGKLYLYFENRHAGSSIYRVITLYKPTIKLKIGDHINIKGETYYNKEEPWEYYPSTLKTRYKEALDNLNLGR